MLAHRWRRRKTEARERERDSQRLRESLRYGRSDRQEKEETGERYLLHGFIRILMIPVREQDKAKETDIRPERQMEVDGGAQGGWNG